MNKEQRLRLFEWYKRKKGTKNCSFFYTRLSSLLTFFLLEEFEFLSVTHLEFR